MLKVADINISEDNCGLYAIKLSGIDSEHFVIIDRKLYFKSPESQIFKSSYNVTVSIEDLAGRFMPKTVDYQLNTYDCL